MKPSLVLLLFFICIIALIISGCTSISPRPETTPATPIPHTTVILTTVAITETPSLEVPTTETLEGTITVTIPSMDAVKTGLQSSSIREETAYGDVYVDGVNVGQVSSAAPASFRVSVGTHRINVVTDEGYEYGYKQIDVQFGKPNPVTYDRDVLSTTAQKNAQAQETQTGLLTYSGSGDNIYKFTVTTGGAFIVSSTYTGTHNFIVEIDDQSGHIIELPVNEIGSYSGKDIVSLDPGIYFLSVKSSGPFTVQIVPA